MSIFKRNKDIIKKTDGISLKSQFNKELMKITPFNNSFKEHCNPIEIGQANNILSVVPNVLASQTLSQAYRVVMPKGAIGNLMQYKTGLLGTPIVDPVTNKITAHAGLASLNPSAIALGAFTATSFVTGQYFMAEIRKELTEIKTGLNRIEGMLEDTKISEVDAAIFFIRYAEENMNEILLVNEHKIATLTNVQRSTNILFQNSLYYERQIRRTITNIGDTRKTNEIEKNYNNLEEFILLWCKCTYGYYYGKIVEIKLSENYDNNYLINSEKELMERAAFFNDNIRSFLVNLNINLDNSNFIQRNFLEKMFGFFDNKYETKNEIKVENIKLQFDVLKIDLEKKYLELCKIPKGIEKLRNLDDGFEYVIEGGNIYLLNYTEPRIA
jgi:hypothetical protein